MDRNEFLQRQQVAVQNMREMNRRAKTNADSQIKHEEQPPKKQPQINSKGGNQSSGFALNDILKNSDTSLILGLLLLLFSENADKKLLFALIYILL